LLEKRLRKTFPTMKKASQKTHSLSSEIHAGGGGGGGDDDDDDDDDDDEGQGH